MYCLQHQCIAESLLSDCPSLYFLTLPLNHKVLVQDSDKGAHNFCKLGDSFCIRCILFLKYPTVSIVLAPGPIPHLVNLGYLLPPAHNSADQPDSVYSVLAPVRLLIEHGPSSSPHICKYIIEVLAVLHQKPSNSSQPIQLLLS